VMVFSGILFYSVVAALAGLVVYLGWQASKSWVPPVLQEEEQ